MLVDRSAWSRGVAGIVAANLIHPPYKEALTLLQLTIFFGLDPLGLVPWVNQFFG